MRKDNFVGVLSANNSFKGSFSSVNLNMNDKISLECLFPLTTFILSLPSVDLCMVYGSIIT